MAVGTLFHGIRVVVVVATDISLPYPRAAATDSRRFKVFAYNHIQVAVCGNVKCTRRNLVRGTHHAGHHIDGTIGGIHPNTMAVVISGRSCVYPGGPAHGNGVNHQGFRFIVGPELEAQDILSFHGIFAFH